MQNPVSNNSIRYGAGEPLKGFKKIPPRSEFFTKTLITKLSMKNLINEILGNESNDIKADELNTKTLRENTSKPEFKLVSKLDSDDKNGIFTFVVLSLQI